MIGTPGVVSHSPFGEAARDCATLEVFSSQPGALGDPGQHPRTNFRVVMKSEDKIRPSSPSQNTVGAHRPLDPPANAQERGKNSPRFRRGPLAHRKVTDLLPQPLCRKALSSAACSSA